MSKRIDCAGSPDINLAFIDFFVGNAECTSIFKMLVSNKNKQVQLIFHQSVFEVQGF